MDGRAWRDVESLTSNHSRARTARAVQLFEELDDDPARTKARTA
jgi:hypothetical protein